MKTERAQALVVRVVAAVVMANGFLALFRPLAERLPERVEALLTPVSVEYAGRSLDLLLGITLVYLSVQLVQRKQVAWRIAVAVSALLAASHLAVSHYAVAALGPLVGLGALLVTKDYFCSRSETSSVRQGLVVLTASVGLATLYGTTGFWLMDRRDFGIDFSLHAAIVHTVQTYLLLGTPDLTPHTPQARWFLDSLAVAGMASIIYGFYSLFRPLAFRLQVLPEELKRMAGLVERYSTSSDDYFKLWPHDKAYYFLPSGKAGVAYGVKSGVAVAVGDPAGPAGERVQAARGFGEMCVRNGWSTAFVYIGGDGLNAYKAAGYDVLKVGEDAVVDLDEFAGHTARNKHFRNIRNRFEKNGYRLELHQPPHSAELMGRLARISRDWLAGPDRQEWKFFAGSFSAGYLQQCPVWVAYGPGGRAEAFANQIPVYRDGWATVDLMRQSAEAPAGLMDYLFMEVMLRTRGAGYRKFNLGLAPLSGLGGEVGRPEEKLLGLIYRSNQKFISLQGLRQFKAKFEPEWEPKYIAYRGRPARLPRIALALARLMRA